MTKISLKDKDRLIKLKGVYGTWRATAKSLGISDRHLRRIRKGERGYTPERKGKADTRFGYYKHKRKGTRITASEKVMQERHNQVYEFNRRIEKTVNIKRLERMGNLYNVEIKFKYISAFGWSNKNLMNAYINAYKNLQEEIEHDPNLQKKYKITSGKNIEYTYNGKDEIPKIRIIVYRVIE